MSELAQRYETVKERVARACAKVGRSPDSVYLIAVTKFAEPEDIQELIELGHRDFGENRALQMAQRAALIEEWDARKRAMPRVSGPAQADPVRWHMIGHLQRNKARKIADCVRLIHSVDSLRLAEELQQIADRTERTIDVLIQVDVAGESQKYGLPIPAIGAMADQIDTMINVRVRGLMTMAPLSDNPEDSRSHFSRCAELYNELRVQGVGEGHFNLLSMGMSNDFEVAIEEGANLVRVGTAIFGERELDEEPEPAHAHSDDA